MLISVREWGSASAPNVKVRRFNVAAVLHHRNFRIRPLVLSVLTLRYIHVIL